LPAVVAQGFGTNALTSSPLLRPLVFLTFIRNKQIFETDSSNGGVRRRLMAEQENIYHSVIFVSWLVMYRLRFSLQSGQPNSVPRLLLVKPIKLPGKPVDRGVRSIGIKQGQLPEESVSSGAA
jgi:hypothetical protein